MASPFPGMNPFLEQADSWQDFHHRFIAYFAELLSASVGENYLVKIEVRLYLHELSAEDRGFLGAADAAICSKKSLSDERTAQGSIAVASVRAPLNLYFTAVETEKHSSIEIRDRRSRRLITVVELLSPTNKRPGPDRDDYLSKRTRLIDGRVNQVEIDLRRGGTRPSPPRLPECDYYVLLSRAADWPKVEVWPIGLRESLPTIPIPLALPDADMLFNLQELLHRVYDAADYKRYIYQEEPEPFLASDQQEWIRQLMPGA